MTCKVCGSKIGKYHVQCDVCGQPRPTPPDEEGRHEESLCGHQVMVSAGAG